MVNASESFPSTSRVKRCPDLFDAADDPSQVTLDCRHLSWVDQSATEAPNTLCERHARAGKHLRVAHLFERCQPLLHRAGLRHGA